MVKAEKQATNEDQGTSDLLKAAERIYREVAKLPGDMYDELDELRNAWHELGKQIRAAGGSTAKPVSKCVSPYCDGSCNRCED